MKSYCVLFSGQSAQEEGMCLELWKLPPAREVLERVRPLLGEDLEEITTRMSGSELSLTYNSQRAIHAHHLGYWSAFVARNPKARLDGAIGHSVGIAAALVAAEAITIEDSCRFVRERAAAFAEICERLPEPHGLIAVFADGLEDNFAEIERFPGITIALHNSTGKAVLGGRLTALQELVAQAGKDGWDARFKPLAVQGPYHTAAFAACRDRLLKVLSKIEVRPPSCPVFMGTSGKGETDPTRIKELLADQPCSRERHLEAVRAAFAHGCRSFLEVAKTPQPIRWISEQLPGAAVDCRTVGADELS